MASLVIGVLAHIYAVVEEVQEAQDDDVMMAEERVHVSPHLDNTLIG